MKKMYRLMSLLVVAICAISFVSCTSGSDKKPAAPKDPNASVKEVFENYAVSLKSEDSNIQSYSFTEPNITEENGIKKAEVTIKLVYADGTEEEVMAWAEQKEDNWTLIEL